MLRNLMYAVVEVCINRGCKLGLIGEFINSLLIYDSLNSLSILLKLQGVICVD